MQRYGSGIIERKIDGFYVLIDGRNATLSAEVPEEKWHKRKEYLREENVIYPNPADLLKKGVLPSFSLIRSAKIKNFVDGIYATIEERVNERRHSLSRTDFLMGLAKAVFKGVVSEENLILKKRIPENASERRHQTGNGYVGNRMFELDMNEGIYRYLSAALSLDTHQDPSMSVPQGFYDWNSQLRDAYKQIKILAKTPGFFIGRENDARLNKEIIGLLHEEIERDKNLFQAYSSILGLYSKTTDKLEDKLCLFPPAKLPDQKFFEDLIYETDIDISNDLGDILVEAIKNNKVSFDLEEDSGLYSRQIQEILPLILKDSEEFKKYLVNEKYSNILEKEFVSQWAGTRHTHVGHYPYDIRITACIDPLPSQKIDPLIIRPELRVEPFSTSYKIMRENLSFLEKAIQEFLPEVLERKRLMSNRGRADITIGEEFSDMKLLLKGLELISKDSIHLTYENKNAENAIKKASKWLSNLRADPDLNRNTSFFVPIIRTIDGSRQIGYVGAGYKTIDIEVHYKDMPSVKILNSGFNYYGFRPSKFKLPVLVAREVRIPYEKMINDRSAKSLFRRPFTEDELNNTIKKLNSGSL